MGNLHELFSRYFEVVPADSEALRETVFRLRYQVYCLETRFEEASTYPDEMERDAFDARSVHCLLRHRETGWWAGTVRLVLPVGEDPSDFFPVELFCGDVFSSSGSSAIAMPRPHTAEVSRFAVSKEFRRRHAEFLAPTGVADDADYDRRGHASAHGAGPRALDGAAPAVGSGRRQAGEGPPRGRRARSEERVVVPHITLGLIQGLVAMSARHGVTHWCAAMERTLLRLLARVGIYFQHVGPLVDYHGKRQPCVADLDNLLHGVERLHPDIWSILTDDGRLWLRSKS